MAWIKTVPQQEGNFHVADREGEIVGTRYVIYVKDDYVDVNEVAHRVGWQGWWWDVAIEEPPSPPPWDAAEQGATEHPASKLLLFIKSLDVELFLTLRTSIVNHSYDKNLLTLSCDVLDFTGHTEDVVDSTMSDALLQVVLAVVGRRQVDGRMSLVEARKLLLSSGWNVTADRSVDRAWSWT